MLYDSFGRKHDYLRLSLTERCNLRCFYCMPEEGLQLSPKSHVMTNEEIVEISDIFVKLGVKKIRLTGGEPLIRKGVDDILSELGKLPVDLAITTNGVNLERHINSLYDAGVNKVNVSLDTLVSEKFKNITRRDYFSKVIGNIDALIDRGFFVKVNVVLIKGVNDEEIIDFVNWTKNRNVHIRFIEFMPFDGNSWDWSKGVSFDQLMCEVGSSFDESEIVTLIGDKNDTSKNFRIEGHQGTFGMISSVTNPFCGTCNRVRLTANGRLKNCLFSAEETDILTAYRAGENIIPIITESILNKKKMRSGYESFEEFSSESAAQNNRSMNLIGG